MGELHLHVVEGPQGRKGTMELIDLMDLSNPDGAHLKEEMCRDCGQAHSDPAVCRAPDCECPECPECGDCPRCDPEEYARLHPNRVR